MIENRALSRAAVDVQRPFARGALPLLLKEQPKELPVARPTPCRLNL